MRFGHGLISAGPICTITDKFWAFTARSNCGQLPLRSGILLSDLILLELILTVQRTSSYQFIGFGDLHGPKPYQFIGFGDLHDPLSVKQPFYILVFGLDQELATT